MELHVSSVAEFESLFIWVVERVAKQIIAEMRAVRQNDFSSIGEPLRWSMHGGPGTGKTHVIKLLKE